MQTAVAEVSPARPVLSQKLQRLLAEDLLLLSELTGHNFERRIPVNQERRKKYFDQSKRTLMNRYGLNAAQLDGVISKYKETNGPSRVKGDLRDILLRKEKEQ